MPDAPLDAPFEAYVGDAPYLFASYAHLDGAAVFPELKLLRDQGYRIWYDEGIDPGNEWPEEVAKALASSGLFVVFISPNAVNSQNVRNEINYALNNRKPFVAIHIVETQLPPGLQLRMGDIQAIMKYRMVDESYRRKLAKTLPDSLRSAEVLEEREMERKNSEEAVLALTRVRNAFLLGWDIFALLSPDCLDMRATAKDIEARLRCLDLDITYPNPLFEREAYLESLHPILQAIFSQIRARHGEEILRYFVLSVNTLIPLGRGRRVSFEGILHALEVARVSDDLRMELETIRGRYARNEFSDTDQGPLFAWANRVHDYFALMK